MVIVPELVNLGNVLAAAASGGVRLDVDPTVVALVAAHGQETGSNANGSWIRFANGVQICWHILPPATSNFGTGSVFKTAPALFWTYPQPFVAQPVRVAGVRWSSGSAIGVEFSGGSGADTGYAAVGATSSSQIVPMLVAIARWK